MHRFCLCECWQAAVGDSVLLQDGRPSVSYPVMLPV